MVTVAPALPTFSEKTPRAWFMLAESRFKVNKLTSDDDKVCRVLEALPTHVFERLAAWLDIQENLVYSELKSELLSYYTASTQKRAQQILELLTQRTDETPSSRWRQIEALQVDKDSKRMDLGWELWLNSLPATVRVHIQNSTDDKADIIRRADSLQRQLGSSEPSPIASINQKHRAKASETDEQRDAIINGLCWFHRRFKEKARRCRSGCKHHKPAKNEGASHQ